MARKADRYPGNTHIWRGLEKLSDLVAGITLYGKVYG